MGYMFEKIKSPKTGKWVSINSSIGKRIINEFKNQIAGGQSNYTTDREFEEFRRSAGNKNAYEILGLPSDATPKDIRKTFRKLALKWHSDKVPDKTSEQQTKEYAEMFTNVDCAFKILFDNDQGSHRAKYDRWLRSQPRPRPSAGSSRPS